MHTQVFDQKHDITFDLCYAKATIYPWGIVGYHNRAFSDNVSSLCDPSASLYSLLVSQDPICLWRK